MVGAAACANFNRASRICPSASPSSKKPSAAPKNSGNLMKSTPATHALEKLARSYSERHLAVNAEYQRGAAWNVRQQRALIDSILRGFVLPIFYVHVVKTPNLFTGFETVTAWLVDGQQRLNAITEYMRGRFALNDPSLGTTGLAMAYERLNPPRWAGKRFEDLEELTLLLFLKMTDSQGV